MELSMTGTGILLSDWNVVPLLLVLCSIFVSRFQSCPWQCSRCWTSTRRTSSGTYSSPSTARRSRQRRRSTWRRSPSRPLSVRTPPIKQTCLIGDFVGESYSVPYTTFGYPISELATSFLGHNFLLMQRYVGFFKHINIWWYSFFAGLAIAIILCCCCTRKDSPICLICSDKDTFDKIGEWIKRGGKRKAKCVHANRSLVPWHDCESVIWGFNKTIF